MPKPVSPFPYGPLLLGTGLFVLAGGGLALALTMRRRQESLAASNGTPPALPAPAQPAATAPSSPPRPSSPPASSPPKPRPDPGSQFDLTPRDIRKMAENAVVPTPQQPSAPAASPPVDPARTLRQGMKGDDVRGVQLLLIALGHNIEADGDFGPKTAAAVRVVQQQAGLKSIDGIVGPATRAALQAAYKQLLVNSGAKPL